MKSTNFATSFALTILLLCCNAYAGDEKNIAKIVTVGGQCTTDITSDRASVTFVIEHTNDDVKSAISKSTALHEKLRDELKRVKAKDLELSTSEYSVFERKEWEKTKQVSKGYSSRIGVKATTSEISKLGELVATAARLGIKETGSLNAYLSDAKILEEKKKCLTIAARNAREKAEALAQSLGIRLGRAVQVIERDGGAPTSPQPMYEMRMQKSAMADAVAPTLDAPKQTLNQQVDVSFAIE